MTAHLLRHTLSAVAAAALAVTALAAPAVSQYEAGDATDPVGSDSGPPYNFTTELVGQYDFIPLKDKAMLTRTKHGYLFRTGQQDSHLVVTRVKGKLRFADTGTQRFKKLANACHRRKVRPGIAAVCRIPGGITVAKPLLIEVWPRLGNDYTNTSKLPATFVVSVLGDKGRDVARFGDGRDYFNGYSGRDKVYSGAGNDWIRSGLDNDLVYMGPGDDDIVAVEGHDRVYGGPGADRLGGGPGADTLSGGIGADYLLCGSGRDSATIDGSDRVLKDCEITTKR